MGKRLIYLFLATVLGVASAATPGVAQTTQADQATPLYSLLQTSEVSPSLPNYLIVYNATPNSVTFAWDTNTTRPAGAYGLALKNSQGSFVVDSSMIVPGTRNMITVSGLQPNTKVEAKLQSYEDINKTNPSVMSATITGYSLDDLRTPSISNQPRSIEITPGSSDRSLTVTASPPESGGTLSYTWYKLEKPSGSYIGEWKAVQDGASNELSLVDSAESPAIGQYYVEVRDTQLKNGIYNFTNSVVASVTYDTMASGLEIPGMKIEMSSPDFEVVGDGVEYFSAFSERQVRVTVKLDASSQFDRYADEAVLKVTSAYSSRVLDPSPILEDGTANFMFTPRDLASAGGVLYLEASFAGNSEVAASERSMVFNFAVVDISRRAHYIDYIIDGDYHSMIPSAITRYTPLTSLSDPVLQGAEFDGWKTAQGDLVSGLPHTQASIQPGTTVLYGSWNYTDYPLTYHLDGGTNSPHNPHLSHRVDPYGHSRRSVARRVCL